MKQSTSKLDETLENGTEQSVFEGCNEKIFMTPIEVGKILKIPTKTVLALARSGEIPGKKYGKHWRFLLADLIRHHQEESSLKKIGSRMYTRESANRSGFHPPNSKSSRRISVPVFNWTDS